jgi:homoserine kinase type II
MPFRINEVVNQMALYVRLDKAKIEILVRRFGVDDVTSFSVMDGGSENNNYCIETKSGKYVLTLCDQKSFDQATNLTKLLIDLTDHGIRTSEVIVPDDGHAVILHDEKPVMLKRHVDGHPSANLSEKLLIQLGEEMARLHAIPAPAYLPKAFPYGRCYFHELIDSNIDHAYIVWLSQKQRYLQARIPGNLPKALIHGDIFCDNLIVQGDQLKGIIDFEEACNYYRSFDLGMVIVGTCRDHQGICFEKARQLLRGYQNELPVDRVERESLQTFIIYAAVATSFWRFRHYHVRRPEPECYDKHVEMQTLADVVAEYPAANLKELFDQATV